MDYDRKKLKTMWGQFWAAHQVSLHSVWRPLVLPVDSVCIHYQTYVYICNSVSLSLEMSFTCTQVPFVSSAYFSWCINFSSFFLSFFPVQRFFKYLCIAAKVPAAIQLAKRGLQEGKCVVIGLQSTGEARTLEQLEQSHGELSGFISTAK